MTKASVTVAVCAALLSAGAVHADPGGLAACKNALATCSTNLSTCNGNLSTVEAQLNQCVNTDLPACTAALAQCQKFPATGQTVSMFVGDDGYIQAGALLKYMDNGDGTITDLNTRLMWEKKSDDGGLHDEDNCYYWKGQCSGNSTVRCGTDADCVIAGGTCDAYDCSNYPNPGLTMLEWVALLNAENAGAGFAGHKDWRIPNIKELMSLVDFGRAPLSLDPVFNTGCIPGCTVTECSCTKSVYGSSTPYGASVDTWFVQFSGGPYFYGWYGAGVRAVRGGL